MEAAGDELFAELGEVVVPANSGSEIRSLQPVGGVHEFKVLQWSAAAREAVSAMASPMWLNSAS